MSVVLEPGLLVRAGEVVSAGTGFRDSAIAPAAVERVLRAELGQGRTQGQLLAELREPGSLLARRLVSAVLVGETYFFRHPEQFHFLAQEALPSVLRKGANPVRGWSAGCSSGEEAYSLAACLLACVPPGTGVEVLGTDLHEGRLELARQGSYGAWSNREAGPHLFPLYREAGERRMSILPHVRAVTRFAQGNLLEPLPAHHGSFHIIFCRNVLTYFSPEAHQQALSMLARALEPGGFMLLGTVEADQPPPGLVRVGAPELQAFRRPLPEELVAPRPPPRAPSPPPPPPPAPPVAAAPRPAAPTPPSPVRTHLEALHCIEGGDEAGAMRLLESLLSSSQDYLPGMLELALLRERAGARQAASALMQAVRERASRLPPDQVIDGPEPLPARFYRASADAFLTLGANE